MRFSGFLLFSLCLATTVFSQGTQLLREPTISAESVAFVYADDIWIASRDGGIAKRLTSAEGTETVPHFSPDGKWIAFTGQYAGNTDVYLIPSAGGDPQRLTWHPGADIVQGWTPDGSEIVFRSSREATPITAEGKFYTVSKDGGWPQPLPIPRADTGELSPDGKYVAYQRVGFWDPEWRNYRGGQALPIWIVDLETLALQQTPQTDRERHTNPVWFGETVYFLSERDYANNIWSYNPKTETLTQVTSHKDFDVKSLDSCEDAIVYEQGGYLHVLDPVSGSTSQLNISVLGDFQFARERWIDVSASSVSNPSLSPTGKRAVFEFRGEILTVPAENGTIRNISDQSKAADRYPVWSPKGDKIAWFSDLSGEYSLMIADQDGMSEPEVYGMDTPTFFFEPDWSPDGKHIAFTDTDYKIWIFSVDTKEFRHVDTEGYAHPTRSMNPVWSPDSKWIAYAKILDSHLKAIFAYNIDSGEVHQLTDGMADAIDPVWDESGQYLYFLASTNFGLNTGWLDMSTYERPFTRGLYLIVLSDDGVSPFLPESDEESVATTADDSDSEEPQESEDDETDSDGKPVRIDLEGINQRIIPVDVPVRSYVGLLPAPEGNVFFLQTEDAQFTTSSTLHKYSLKDREATEILSNVSDAVISADRKKMLYRQGNNWSIAGTSAPVKPGDGQLNFSGAQIKLDPQAEWLQIYREGWRYQRDFLYVNNVHGAPWEEVYDWYRPWVDHVKHRSDLNYIIDILGGEVAVGHSYTSGGDLPRVRSTAVGLLGADISADGAFYRIEKVYTGEAWNPDLQAPLAMPGAVVDEGEYLLAVNGVDLRTSSNLFSAFEGLAGKQVKILVNSDPSKDGARTVTVVPVSSDRGLRQYGWIEHNRRTVDELSDGKLAYVWLPNTGFGGYNAFNRYFFAQQDRKGAVIDQRNNGGGSAADYIADILARDLHGYFNSKVGDHRPFTTPIAGLWGPKVMIINERAGSGGDLLPYLFRRMEIGPLVGTRTWGGLVGTWDTPPFVDGGRMVAPRGGFFDVNGEWAVEGEGIAPDIEVIQNPAAEAAGRDPQLERAIEEALRLIETEGITLKPEPAPPIRYRRPTGN